MLPRILLPAINLTKWYTGITMVSPQHYKENKYDNDIEGNSK